MIYVPHAVDRSALSGWSGRPDGLRIDPIGVETVPQVPDAGPREGDVIGGAALGQDLGRGWFVAAGPEGSEPGLLYVRPTPGWAEVMVDDDGPGIPAAAREGAFKPFASFSAGGTGLGLAIARDIARAHGGEIVLQESPMGGLRAVVRLPM